MPLRRIGPIPLSNDTIAKLNDEVMNARYKFGNNKRLTVALMEEVGELAQAQLQGKSEDDIKGEALQVACVALRIFEETDADLSCNIYYETKNDGYVHRCGKDFLTCPRCE
jgi:NTP pyrophosphatase (non-canonical NTP hydrolase)